MSEDWLRARLRRARSPPWSLNTRNALTDPETKQLLKSSTKCADAYSAWLYSRCVARNAAKDSRWPKIADDLRKRINAGEWAPGEKIPSQRELMESYQTPSPLDVVRAVAALTAEGLILTEPGAPRRGARVRQRQTSEENIMRAIVEDHAGKDFPTFEEVHGEAATTTASYITVAADGPAAADLEITPGTQILCRRLVFALHSAPHSVYLSYLPLDIAATAGFHAPECEVPGRGVVTWLQTAGFQVGRVTTTLTTRLATQPDIEQLQLPRGAPVHERRSVVRDTDGRPLAVSTHTSGADRGKYVWDYDCVNGQVA